MERRQRERERMDLCDVDEKSRRGREESGMCGTLVGIGIDSECKSLGQGDVRVDRQRRRYAH